MQDLINEILKLSTKDKFPFYLINTKTNKAIKIIHICKDGIIYENEFTCISSFKNFSKENLIAIKNCLTNTTTIWND